MRTRPLPVGVDDFEKIRLKEYYYVDKTLLVKELLDKKGEVNLFTRPRRFGKTLTLSMLRHFFEDTGNTAENKAKETLFDGLQIMEQGEAYTQAMSGHPVISLTLKSSKQPTWELAYGCSIVRKLIENADISVKSELEELLAGGVVEKPVHEDITYDSVYDSEDNLWNFLFFTGYLKFVSRRLEQENQYITMGIPNLEVRYIYNTMITNWFRERIRSKDLSSLYRAIQEGNVEVFERELSGLLKESISYMDAKEVFYHGFLLGVLGNMGDCLVKSNRESGNGRLDIMVKNLDDGKAPIVMELKVSESFIALDAACDKAIQQIEEKEYDAWAVEEGYTEVIHYGIAFFRKRCKIKMKRRNF